MPPPGSSVTPPNILLITTDQQRWDALSLWGQPGYRTPNLDRLAREGMVFDRAYTPAPICTPARVSILTGTYPSRHGAYTLGVEPVPALTGPTLGSCLRTAGYATALIGKTHFVARDLELQHVAGRPHPAVGGEVPPEDFWTTFDGPYVGFDLVRHCSVHTCDRPPDGHYRAWLRRQGLNLDHLFYGPVREQPRRMVPHPGPWAIAPEHTQTHWITEESIAFMERVQATGRPWLCWASYQDPHPPFVCPEPFFSSVDMTGVELGGLRPGEMDDKPGFLRRFAEGKYWTEAPDVHYWDGINVPGTQTYRQVRDARTSIQAYIGMVNMLDEYIGRLLSALDRMNQRANTLILFTTDHGELLGRHGLWQKGIPAYDDVQRIPLLAAWPAGQRGPVGHNAAAHASLVDILPTCLEAAGLEIPIGVQGVSQLPVLRGATEAVRDWALIDFAATVNLHQQTLVHGGWKLVVYEHADCGELYDLVHDPDQYVNRFGHPESRAQRDQLLHRLVRANMETAGKPARRVASS